MAKGGRCSFVTEWLSLCWPTLVLVPMRALSSLLTQVKPLSELFFLCLGLGQKLVITQGVSQSLLLHVIQAQKAALKKQIPAAGVSSSWGVRMAEKRDRGALFPACGMERAGKITTLFYESAAVESLLQL